MKYFYYPNGYFDINYIQMFLLNKKSIHKKLQKLMQLMKAELYKLKSLLYIMYSHAFKNTIPHKSTFL